MMYKIEYSPQALEDLLNIYDYTNSSFGNKSSKDSLKRLTNDIYKLVRFPLLGIELKKIINITTDYRYLVSGKNYIFYYIKDTTIKIVRVLHQKQDYIKSLFPNYK